jgi:hypothetical protein
MGTEHSATTDRFLEAKFHWLLSGNQSSKAAVASVVGAGLQISFLRHREWLLMAESGVFTCPLWSIRTSRHRE